MITQLRRFSLFPSSSNLTEEANKILPKEFWDQFSSSSHHQKVIIPIKDIMFLELVHFNCAGSAILHFKIPNIPNITIAEWHY